MRRLCFCLFVALGLAASAPAAEIIASDNAANPAYVAGLDNGSNGGFGFEPWTISGFGTFSGGFIGNSTQNGRESVNSAGNLAFGLYANPSFALSAATRIFEAGALRPGQTFSCDMSFSWNGGARGLNLYAGDFTNEVLNLNHQGSDQLFIGGAVALPNVFNKAIHVSFTALSTTQVIVRATGASLPPFENTNFVSALPDRFRFYYFNSVFDGANHANYEPYFNNLEVVDDTYHYVRLDNPTPVSPYNTWATAAIHLQDAIDLSAPGDTVLVSNGVHDIGGRVAPGSSLTNRVLIDKPIRVQSLNGPEVSIIRGQGTVGNDPVRCVWLADGATLSGFTLTNGATLSSTDSADDDGGGVWCQSSNAVVSDCLITGNAAGNDGGGTYGGRLDRCLLRENTSVYGGGAGFNANLGILNNCAVIRNTAFYGGGVYSGWLNNCTLSGNTAFIDGGGAYGAVLNNSIIQFNSANAAPNHAISDLTFCCTTPHPGTGDGNITSDPQFVNAAAGDYRVLPGSPCIGAGNNALVVGTTDLNGNPRIFRDVDMGAYEAAAIATVTSNDGISIVDQANAVPYPSIITVGGVSGPVVGLRVRLNGFSHSTPADVDAYLASPAGQVCVLMSDAGSSYEALGVDVLFDDAASTPIPQAAPITNGTYQPADYSMIIPDSLPPGMIGPLGSNLTDLVASGVNGNWKLYLSDDADEDIGSIASWSLEFEWYFDPTNHYTSLTNATPAWPHASWATAATTIQGAIDAATAGDTVFVSNGVYEVGTRGAPGVALQNRVLIDKPIRVQSVNGPELTVIRGQGPLGNSAVRCAWMADGATLEGFTLTNGATRIAGSANTEQSGGGLWCASAAAVVTHCRIVNNAAESQGGGAFNGTLNNCLLQQNTAVIGGGASFGGPGAEFGSLRNCTLTENTASAGGGVYFGNIFNSIIYFNTVDFSGPNHANAVMSYSCTTPDPGGAGNIIGDPQFVNAAGGDYHLQPASSCLNAGYNPDAADATDLDNNPRIVAETVDIGAYEYTGFVIDSDGDDFTDYEEYISDTDAQDANSYFPPLAFSNSPPGTLGLLVSSSSTARVYGLLATTNLLPPQVWTPTLESPGNGAALIFTISNNVPTRFYRSNVRLP